MILKIFKNKAIRKKYGIRFNPNSSTDYSYFSLRHTPLHQASGLNYVDDIKQLIEIGANVKAKGFLGETPLHIACERGHIEVAKLLIDAGANIEAKDNNGVTPLHRASCSGSIETVKLLIDKGDDIEAKIHRKFYYGSIETAKLLIDKGANIEAQKDNGETPLHWASYYGSIETAKLLIDAGANIEAKKDNGETPIYIAVDKGYVEVAKLLMDADVNYSDEKGFALLKFAIMNDSFDAIKLLVECGVDVNYSDEEGGTPLLLAILLDKFDEIKLLVELGADTNYYAKSWTPLTFAISQDKLDAIKLLVELGADTNYYEEGIGTPLKYAIFKDKLDAIKLLVELGVDIDYFDESNLSPLKYAISQDKLDAIKPLVELGADTNYYEEGIGTPLTCAIFYDKLDMIKILVELGADINYCIEGRLTPLKFAISQDKLDAIKLLVEFGVDINYFDKSNLSPLKYAISQDKLDAIKLLVELGADINYDDEGNWTPLKFATQNNKLDAIKILRNLGAKETQLDTESSQQEAKGTKLDTESSQQQEVKNIDPNNMMSVFDNVIGLDSIKENVDSFIKNIKVEKLRDPNKKIIIGHYIFQGNPGTGKTTIARKMGEIFKALGLLSKGHLVEVTREDLVGKHIGHSEKNTKNFIEQAQGGVLFIDEVYSLNSGGSNDFGKEVINTLVPALENLRDEFVVIIAGYTNPMRDFLRTNSGLAGRFNHTIDFKDYTTEELLEIFKVFAKKDELQLSTSLDKTILDIFKNLRDRKEHFANGREARQLLEHMRTELNKRLSNIKDLTPGDPRLYSFEKEDIPSFYMKYLNANNRFGVINEEDFQTALSHLDEVIGLQSVKDTIKSKINQIKLAQRRNSIQKGREITLGHYIFRGNPGTGKTMIANIMDDMFKALGLLPDGHIVEVTREDLVSNYIGETAMKTKKVLESALGGVLFIDEAYTLNSSSSKDHGHEAIDTIVPFMEKYRNELVIIIAGYPNKMDEFLNSNTGLKSRFTDTIEFEDYSNEELFDILQLYIKKDGYTLESGLKDVCMNLFQEARESSDHFGNARTIRKLYGKISENMDNRLAKTFDSKDLFSIVKEDLVVEV